MSFATRQFFPLVCASMACATENKNVIVLLRSMAQLVFFHDESLMTLGLFCNGFIYLYKLVKS
jgi:hypothetical protein